MEPSYQKRGGGAIGYCWPLYILGTWPFVRLQIYTDKVVFSEWPFKSVVKVKDIDFINRVDYEIISRTLGYGVKINHHGPNMPYLVFIPPDINELLEAFRKIGVKIKE